MTITSTTRGHPTYYYGHVEKYTDTQLDARLPRPCTKCNHPPRKEGYDYCLGYIEGVKSACCGHGKKTGYIKMMNGLKLIILRDGVDDLKTQF